MIMQYQKIFNMLHNTSNQPTKFRTKNWIEINDEERGTYNTNSQITFKTSILMSSLCDYSDAFILVKITISIEAKTGNKPNNRDKKFVFNICAPFTDCISEINNT